jgi:hypothetical protein
VITGWRDADFERLTFGFRVWAGGGEVALGRRLYRVRWWTR